jgi:hypothetical protein
MPTIPCRRCNATIDVSPRSLGGRVYCPSCRDWFSPSGVDIDPTTAIRPTSPDATPRLDPRPEPRHYELDDYARDAEDADRRRRIRRQRRHIADQENPELRPPEGRNLALSAQIILGLIGVGHAGLLALDFWWLINQENDQNTFFALWMQGSFGSMVNLLAAIVFLAWLQKAHRNIRHLRGPKMTWSAGWTIGGFFIPLANLVIPFLAIQEMWRASDPGTVEEADLVPGRSAGSVLVMAWWGLWIVVSGLSIVFQNFAFFFLNNVTGLLQGQVALHAVLAVDAVLAMLVVGAMVRRQEARWQAILAADPDAADLTDEPEA